MLAKIFSTPDMNVRHFWVNRVNISRIKAIYIVFSTLHITRVNRLTYHTDRIR